MIKSYLLLVFLIVLFPAWTQINCHTITIQSRDSTICHHQNDNVSSISWRSVEHENYYHFKAFDIHGNTVLEANHGYLHGSASLTVKYHSNGAIKSARKTFQPDGGIQHWDVTSFYNEEGTFHHEEDNSCHTPTTILTEPFQEKQIEIVKKEIPVDSVAVILKNSTSVKIHLLVKDLYQKTENRIVTIRKNKEVEIGKYLPVKGNNDPSAYFELIVLPDKRKTPVQLIWKPEFMKGTINRIALIQL
jgi:hypothetical protein